MHGAYESRTENTEEGRERERVSLKARDVIAPVQKKPK
jgi:hypothetical protein